MTLVLPANVYPSLPGHGDKSAFYEWDCGIKSADQDANVECAPTVSQSSPINTDECKRLTACCKRKSCNDDLPSPPPPKRISPYWNTPKQRKDDRRRVLNVTTRKLRQITDPERCLHRSVLLNNTLQRIQHEQTNEENKSPVVPSSNQGWARRARQWREAKTSQRQTTQPNLFDDHFAHWGDADNKMDAVDDGIQLARNVNNLLSGGSCNNVDADAYTMTDDVTSAQMTLLANDIFNSTQELTTTAPSTSSMSQHVHIDTASPSFSNLTEDERMVLGEMDTVLSNFMKVIATANS